MTLAERTQVVDISALSAEDVALLTYFSDERAAGTYDVKCFSARFPFARFLFTPQDLETRLHYLASQRFLTSREQEGGGAIYTAGPRLDRQEVLDVGHAMPFVTGRAVGIMNKIPLSAFAELKTAVDDPCLAIFKENRRVADNPEWWNTLCDLSVMFRDVAAKTQPISGLIGLLSAQMGHAAVGKDPEEPRNRWLNAQWEERGKVSVAFEIDKVTPWKDLRCQASFVRAADFTVDQRNELSREALEALLRDFTLEHIVVPVGEMGEAAADVFRSVKGVVLWAEDIKDITMSRHPRERFREILRKRLDIRLLSPYQARGSVPDSMFFGREEELRIILAQAETNFAVYGSRRSGKTSLLKQIQRIMTGERKVVFLDCEVGVSTEAQLATALCAELDLPRADDLAALARQAQGIPADTVLLIDEFDPLLDRGDPSRILGSLRKLSEERGVRCIIAGWIGLHRLCKDIRGPMFNFAQSMFLGPLTEKEAMDLARDPMAGLGVTFEQGDSTVKQLVHLTGCFPHLTQVMCTGLVKRLSASHSRLVTRDLLDDVLATEIAQEVCDIFYYTLDDTQKLIVCSSLLVKQMSLPLVVEKVQSRVSILGVDEIRAALDSLVLLFLFRYSAGKYEWMYDQFPGILKRNIDADFLLAQITKRLDPTHE